MRRLSLLAFLLLAVTSAHAIPGPCTNSPECPTAVLGLVGVAALTLARRFKR